MKRRDILHSAVVGTAGIALAGCLGGSDGDSIQIGSIAVLNSDSRAHTVDIDVRLDGDSVVQETYELEAGEAAEPIDDALPDDSGTYEIEADPADIDGETFNPGTLTDRDCIPLEIEILGGDLGVVQQPVDEEC